METCLTWNSFRVLRHFVTSRFCCVRFCVGGGPALDHRVLFPVETGLLWCLYIPSNAASLYVRCEIVILTAVKIHVVVL